MIRRRIRNEPSLLRKAFFGIEWLTLRRSERRTCPRVGINVVMSDLDLGIMHGDIPTARFAVVENGVDIDFFAANPPAGGRALIFAGRLDQYSNRDAILHFMAETWPRVTTAHPDATITIIGSNPPEALVARAAADPRITVTGFVDDVRPYFTAATVAICPIRDGGGTRIKILDALAQARPIVSTSIGCEGIDVVPDRDVLIGDDPETFARQIGRLFDDEALAPAARRRRPPRRRKPLLVDLPGRPPRRPLRSAGRGARRRPSRRQAPASTPGRPPHAHDPPAPGGGSPRRRVHGRRRRRAGQARGPLRHLGRRPERRRQHPADGPLDHPGEAAHAGDLRPDEPVPGRRSAASTCSPRPASRRR